MVVAFYEETLVSVVEEGSPSSDLGVEEVTTTTMAPIMTTTTISTHVAANMVVALLIDVMRKILAADRYLRTQQSRDNTPWDFFTFGSKYRLICNMHDALLILQLLATLVLCCALNEQTKRIINWEVMLVLGKQGFIVNVGRGGLIDEKELVKCLMEGEIGGAGLDVFENEPRVPEELLEMNNVVLSPHAAALTVESMMNLCELMGGNLEAFFSNKPRITPVMLAE
uniref:D-isomer specific 2-hydroxyacid dehydrogenase NAD-binding domain-containing protein n=1 Tax=Glycine max TaxID=3847 RepID=A0A0R0KIU5_SOYBN